MTIESVNLQLLILHRQANLAAEFQYSEILSFCILRFAF